MKFYINILLFTGKSESMQSFRIESVVAGGPAGEKPPVAPENIRLKPKNGLLFGLSTLGSHADRTQTVSHGARISTIGDEKQEAMYIVIPASQQDDASVSYRPAAGRWDLRDFLLYRATG